MEETWGPWETTEGVDTIIVLDRWGDTILARPVGRDDERRIYHQRDLVFLPDDEGAYAKVGTAYAVRRRSV